MTQTTTFIVILSDSRGVPQDPWQSSNTTEDHSERKTRESDMGQKAKSTETGRPLRCEFD